MHSGDEDPRFSLCPHCQCKVDNEDTQCPECGGYFPALRHRKGEVGWGAVCGVIRGLGLVAFVATAYAIVALFSPPFVVWDLVGVFIGATATILLSIMARRCHQRAYHVHL